MKTKITLTPRPAGFRFYHTHLVARDDLHLGQYSGQVGPVYIEPKHEPDEVIEMTFAKRNADDHGFNLWTINEVPFSMEKLEPTFPLRQGRRYRWRMRNASDDIHPMHLHRHSFELTKIAGKPTAGIIKDVVMLGGYQEMEVDFTADNPGLTLFHCHMQLHMDFGFMGLFRYV
jgi:hypothetical protein